MLDVLPRQLLSASRTRPAAAGSARLAFPTAVALAAALVLAPCAFGHAAEPAAVRTSAIPVKAPARSARAARAALSNADLRTAPAAAQPYTAAIAGQHIQAVALDVTTLAAVGIYVGVAQWDWGKTGFHLYKEGWFGKSTSYGGVDKLGHAWSAHVMSDYFTGRLRSLGFDKYQSAVTAALITGTAFLAVEIGDGFSRYGASYEDFVASAVGIGFSFLRNTVPGLDGKVDFRMQYMPTGHGDVLGLGDYSGKKFLLAWKLAGLETFADGPLRYLELHTGYYARGHSEWERAAGVAKTQSPYVGIGLNLSELLFSHPSLRDTPPAAVGRTLARYLQAPYTYIASDGLR
jgi:hypothetical protein